MHPDDLPRIQGRRFDLETLQFNAVALAEQTRGGPTWIRQGGSIVYIMITEELFNRLWPDPRRSWSLDEMPLREEEMLTHGLEEYLNGRADDAAAPFIPTVVRIEPE